jgi:NADH-ubiquinone oxidoreductase chain 6
MRVRIILRLALCRVFLFPLIIQPLRLGLAIILSTIFLCILVAIYLSSWYGYILFLIYVGGLLVMFAYVAALSPNTLFARPGPFLLLLRTQVVVPVILFNSIFLDINDLSFFVGQRELITNTKILGVELVSPTFISVLLGLGIILFINLVVVVKICYYQHGTLRPHKAVYADPCSKNTPCVKNS